MSFLKKLFGTTENETNSNNQLTKLTSEPKRTIFDTIEVKLIGDEGKNVFLKSFNPERVNFDKLKNLIDDLYLIHGNDSSDKGKFTNKDKEKYKDPKFNLLFGRSWTDYPKYKYPVSVSRDEDEISISIWGVDK
jgi:hypothetical protein